MTTFPVYDVRVAGRVGGAGMWAFRGSAAGVSPYEQEF